MPAELESICLKCLEKDPRRRYASAGELAADLRDWFDDRTIVLKRTPWQRRILDGSRRRWLAVGAAVLLLAGLTALAWFLRPDDQPAPKPDPLTTTKQPLAPGVRHDLLTRKPTPLRWPDWLLDKRLNYDSEARDLFVSSRDRGLIGLGETAAPRYRIAVTIQQDPWIGNVGLFFGFRDDPINGAPAQRYQVVQLLAVPGAEQGTLLRVGWKTESYEGLPDKEKGVGRKLVDSQPPFRLTPGKHRLELTIGPEGLEAVALDDKVLPGLSVTNVKDAAPPPADSKGKFGVYLHNGNGTFSEASYLFQEEP